MKDTPSSTTCVETPMSHVKRPGVQQDIVSGSGDNDHGQSAPKCDSLGTPVES